jgi:hypothetical protein
MLAVIRDVPQKDRPGRIAFLARCTGGAPGSVEPMRQMVLAMGEAILAIKTMRWLEMTRLGGWPRRGERLKERR